MSVELIAISSFVVAILGGIAHCVNKSNLKQCKMCCIDSDCRDENKATDLKDKLVTIDTYHSNARCSNQFTEVASAVSKTIRFYPQLLQHCDKHI